MLSMIKQGMTHHHTIFIGIVFLGFSLMGWTQETHPNMNVKFTSSPITIDGNDLEEAWKTARQCIVVSLISHKGCVDTVQF